jgi:diguanylate cyclase (GGDEF)-like protein
MSSLNPLMPVASAEADRAGTQLPPPELRVLLRALTREATAAAATALLRAVVGAAQAELLWLPLARDAMAANCEPALARLGQAAVARDVQVAEPDAPGETLPVWVGVAIPLHCEDRTAAVLACRVAAELWASAECRDRFAWTAATVEAHLCSLHALEDLRGSVRRLEQAERLQRALFAIADQASADRDMPDVFRALHSIVASLMYAENFYIALYNPLRDSLRFAYYVDVADTDPPPQDHDFPMDDRRNSLTWFLVRGGRPLMGTLEQLRTQVEGQIADFGPDCIDWLGVPLLRGNEVVGGIVVQSYSEDARFADEDRTLLTYVAQHIQTALERRMAHDELERRVAERTDALRDANRVLQQQVLERQRGERLQAALFRIAELANTTESTEEFYAAVHRVVGGLLYARNFYIALLSDDQTHLTFPYSVDEHDQNRHPRKLGQGLSEYVLRTGSALLADRAGLERLYGGGEAHPIGTRSRSWLGVPLICADRPVGVLAVQSHTDEHTYTPRDQELLTFVSYHIANALERKRNAETLKQAYARLEQRVVERTGELAAVNRDLREQIMVRERVERQLKYENLHDALTGLPNRNFLIEKLGQALAAFARDARQRFAVLFLDLDRFKVVNDSVGHLVGDELLNEVGARIAAVLEPRDLVARLGGDEFAIVLHGVENAADASTFAQRIIETLNAPIRLSGKELFTSASIGIAMVAPHYRQAEELLRDADVAMYRAKNEGRHRFALFDEQLHLEAMQLLDLESDLRRAIARGEFTPFFQPILRLSDRRIVGYEALLRWRHPQRGLLEPADFLNVAEDTGMAEQIDWKIFERVFEVTPALLGTGAEFISINLSGRHFRSQTVGADFLALLRQYYVAPASIRIEVTERTLIENPPLVKSMLESLRRDGLSFALDDFGTGYSSLSYLHQYPLHALKIDRSFISELHSLETKGSVAVVRAIQALAESLDMDVIAEGIETDAQYVTLVELGCLYGQGFLFGRPQPASVWLERASAYTT